MGVEPRPISERFVESRGARLWTTATGGGIPVLLCSGGPGCCDYLEPVAALIDDFCRVIRFEPSGCGRSDQNPPYSIEACLADIESVREGYGIERWIVAGHSWGADLAVMYALRFPERCAGLICIAGGRFHNDREWHRKYEEGKAREQETAPAFLYPPNMEVNRQGNASWKQYIQRPSLWREIAQLDVPALFVYGADDIRPSWPVEQVARLMPNARFTLIAGADHHIWVLHARELGKSLRDYVDEQEHR